MSRPHNPASSPFGDTELTEASRFYRREITDRLSTYTADEQPTTSFPDAFWEELETDYREMMGRHPRGSDRTGYAIANDFIQAHGEDAKAYFNDLDEWTQETAVPETLDGLSEKNLPVYPASGDAAADTDDYDTVSVDYDDYKNILHAYAMKSVIDARIDGQLLDEDVFDKKPVVMDDQ